MTSIRVAAPSGKCPHCGEEMNSSNTFGRDGRFFHRPCVSRGPVSASLRLKMVAGDVLKWHKLRILMEAHGGEQRPTGDGQMLPQEWRGLGYFEGLRDKSDPDKQEMDVVVGSGDLDTDDVYLVIQLEDGAFRQWKVFLGFSSAAEAEAAFKLVWNPASFGGVWTVPAKKFRKLVLPRLTKEAALVERRERIEYDDVCPHCHKLIHEKGTHARMAQGRLVQFHSACGGEIEFHTPEERAARAEALYQTFPSMRAKTAMLQLDVDPQRIEPPHDVKNEAKFGKLCMSMRTEGWKGRPILAYVSGGGYQALTGSHRLAAAKAVGLTSVPIMLVENGDFANNLLYTLLDEASDNYDRLRALEKAVKANEALLPAYELMLEEVASKNKARITRTSALKVGAQSIRVSAGEIDRAFRIEKKKKTPLGKQEEPSAGPNYGSPAPPGSGMGVAGAGEVEKDGDLKTLVTSLGLATGLGTATPTTAPSAYDQYIKPGIEQVQRGYEKAKPVVEDVAKDVGKGVERGLGKAYEEAKRLAPTLLPKRDLKPKRQPSAPGAYELKPGLLFDPDTNELIPAADKPSKRDRGTYVPRPPQGKRGAAEAVEVPPELTLRRSGYQTYEGMLDGHRIRLRREDVVARGSFPANKRQRRESRWFVSIDAQPVGDAPTFRDAKALAMDACVKFPDGTIASKQAATVALDDGSSKLVHVSISDVKPGDKAIVDTTQEVEDLEGKKVTVHGDEIGHVVEVFPTDPSLMVAVRSDGASGIKQRSVILRPESVRVRVNPDDPRISGRPLQAAALQRFEQLGLGEKFLAPALSKQVVLVKTSAQQAQDPSGKAYDLRPTQIVLPLARKRAQQDQQQGFNFGEQDIADPVFDPSTPWHVRQDLATGQLWNAWENRPLTPEEIAQLQAGTLMPPDVSMKGETQRKQVQEQLNPLLSPAQQQQLQELKQQQKVPKRRPEDIYKPERKVPPKSTVTLQQLPLARDGGVKNILSVLSAARPDEIAYWGRWYVHARTDARALAEKYDVPETLAAALIAVLSPNTKWEDNVFAAEQMLRAQGQKVIDYRKKLDEEGQENWAAKIHPELYVQKETLGTSSYLINIQKAQRLLDAYDAAGRPEKFAIDVEQPLKLEWNPNEEGSREAAAKRYKELTERGWIPRTTQVEEKPFHTFDKPISRWKHTWKQDPDGVVPIGAPFPWKARRLVLTPPLKAAEPPAKSGKNKGKEKEPPKVTAFYLSIMQPQKQKDTVVLDGHAINIWRGEARPLDELKDNAPSVTLREQMIRDYREAAKKATALLKRKGIKLRSPLTPQQVQAITWTVWRDALKNSGQADEDEGEDLSVDESDEGVERPTKKRKKRSVRLVQDGVRLGRLRDDHVATGLAAQDSFVGHLDHLSGDVGPRVSSFGLGVDETHEGAPDLDRIRSDLPRVTKNGSQDGSSKVRIGVDSVHEPKVRLQLKASQARKKEAAGMLGLREMEKLVEMPGTFGIVSAYTKGSKSKNQGRHGELMAELQRRGYTPKQLRPLRGQYFAEGGGMKAEQSVLVVGMRFEDVVELGKMFGQESVIFKAKDGVLGLYYTDGSQRVQFAETPDGQLALGADALKQQQKGPRGAPELWSKSQSTSFEFPLNFARQNIAYSNRPLTKSEARKALNPPPPVSPAPVPGPLQQQEA